MKSEQEKNEGMNIMKVFWYEDISDICIYEYNEDICIYEYNEDICIYEGISDICIYEYNEGIFYLLCNWIYFVIGLTCLYRYLV
jgi:hypothetical protein